MLTQRLIISLNACLILSAPAMAQESPQQSCSNAASLYAKKDLEGALEEARWCVKLMEQEKQGKTATFFKDNILGYSGDEMNQQQVMGMSVIERDYRKKDATINVSLSAGASGAMANAFSAMAQFGLQSGQGKALRIQRRTATDMSDNEQAELQVTLKSGGFITFKSSDIDSEALIAFANAFPVAELDDSLAH
ncbi:hypothetical protein [Neptunicella sp. SCSIO 80796]|uniref:hypothetical protein n=1 Tax=Neptunicella plasticusilytica TaxID=3117012 RepID=UPI003A4DA09F